VTGTRDTSRSDAVIETRGGVTERPDDEIREAPPDDKTRDTPPDDVAVRAATSADLAGIVAVVRKAFGHSLEARLVERLAAEHRVAAAVVAVSERRIVGHALLSRLSLTASGRPALPALALAPVAVAPECQGRGVGSQIVRACLRLADPALPVFVIGAPAFYGRFGFEPAAAHRVSSRFDVASHFFMVRPARPASGRRDALGRPREPGGLDEPGGIGEPGDFGKPRAHDEPDERTLDYPAAFDGS
jgi:putative acetyltransferase